MTNRPLQRAANENSDQGWHGTAGAEEDVVGGKNLNDVLGLDTSRWTVLAIDIFTSGRWDDDSVMVYALDREAHSAETHEDLKTLEGQLGSLPVVRHHIEGVQMGDVIACMKSLHVQLRSRNFQRLSLSD